MELYNLSAYTLSRMLKRGEVSSKEITLSLLKRIDELDKKINAYITVDAQRAISMAEEADRRLKSGYLPSPLNGIPVAIKDNICTEGMRTTCGSMILKNYIPPYDATVVERLKRTGCVILGKTNLDEFGMGSSNENSAFGPARNPFNTDYVTGGSSGGSAAAVASGEAIVALGTDTGGSIRLPSAYCGVVGFKPTYGRVSRFGLISYASSLDQIGTIARDVRDCAMLLNIISGYDPLDSTSFNTDCPDFVSFLTGDIKGVKIGIPREYFVEGLDSRIEEKIQDAIELLRGLGAEIVDISLPHSKYAISTYYLIATAEASSNLARYDGVKFGYRAMENVSDILSMYEKTRAEGFGKEVKRRIMLGTYVLSAGYYDAYYLKALKVRRLIKEDFDRAFEKVDCLIAPVSPCLPFKIGEKMDDPIQMYLVDIYTVSVNLSGLPAVSIRCGEIEGFPVAFQLIGRAFDEGMLLRVADTYEREIKGNNYGI
ncbi:MAG TPA: Asp-tRNA(Asn)/Glu-tRNA(Gln) amidotransferase subunit GatA [Desulfobacteraceae bacterium]|nr:Asp-tRNA(Asn)/Glu-tRNA(Gln) amidotransferase subunit GatA [Desulfobacteraceae bacterium]